MAHTVDVRAADVDRERVLAELQQHTSAGRLSMDEFSVRAAAVYRSRTLGELDALTADLPPEPNPPTGNRFSSSLWSALLWIGLIAALVGVAALAYGGPLGCSW
jgi:DUF1707 SHOCT-like domain